MRSNVLQPAAAALAAACIAVPACIPAAQVAQGAAPTIEIQHSVALPVALSASTTDLLNALGLFVRVPTWIFTANPAGTIAGQTSSGQIPPLPADLIPTAPAYYSSVYTVVNAAIKIISAPAVDLTTGQWGKANTDIQAAFLAFQKSLNYLPTSVIATLQYAISQLTTALGGSAAAAAPTSDATVSALAAAPSATPTAASLLDTLGLLVRVPLWIGTANPAGTVAGQTTGQIPPLPPELVSKSAPYTSVYTVINLAIKILSAPAVDLTTGQWGNIQKDTQTAVKNFQKSLTALQASVTATLQYAASQVQATSGSTATVKTAAAPATEKAAITASIGTDTTDAPVVKTKTKALTAAATPKAPGGGFLKQLQGAVDNEVGGGKVKVSTPDTGSDASTGSGSSGSSTPKHAKGHAAKAASSAAK